MRHADARVSEEPTWIDTRSGWIFAWLTRPADGTARAGAVLVPAVGREAHASHRLHRELAVDLARAGVVSLRFDLSGTGDSGGELSDPDRVGAWLADIRACAQYLHALGVGRLYGVGMRLGATLLAAAASHANRFDQLVLWDPCDSGASYLRQAVALLRMRGGIDVPAPPTGVETTEFHFADSLAAQLRALDLAAALPPLAGTRMLVLTRSDRPVPPPLRRALAAATSVEWRVAADQGDLLDEAPENARIPRRSLHTVTQWLCQALPDPVALDLPVRITEIELPAPGGDGRPVVERCVRFGPQGLFGVLSEPAGAAAETAVVFLNTALEDHTGPGRMWVDLARSWAARGVRSLRFDLAGLGDSPPARRPDGAPMYRTDYVHQAVLAAAAVNPGHPADVVLMGLCSGGFHAAQAALALGAAGVCAINPYLDDSVRPSSAHSIDLRRRAGRLIREPVRRRVVAPVRAVRALVPSRRVAAGSTLARLHRGATQVLLVAGAEDAQRFSDLRASGGTTVPTPRLRCELDLPEVDHSLHRVRARQVVARLLEEHLVGMRVLTPTAADHEAPANAASG